MTTTLLVATSRVPVEVTEAAKMAPLVVVLILVFVFVFSEL